MFLCSCYAHTYVMTIAILMQDIVCTLIIVITATVYTKKMEFHFFCTDRGSHVNI